VPLPTSSTLKAWLAAEGQPDPLVTLYDIEVSDAVTLRLVEGNPTGKTLTFNGNVYTPAAIRREELSQTIEGDLGAFRLAVSNIDGIAGGYIEQNELEGRQVTITMVPLSTLSPADSLVETYTIQEQAYNREAASVTLGHTNLFKRKIPWLRFIRPRCQWGYERRFDWLDQENGCRAYSDEFEDDTTQYLFVGGTTDSEQRRRFGWYSLNALKVSAWDTNTTLLSEMVVETSSNSVAWSGTSLNAPFMYRKIVGDFDVWTRVIHRAWRSGGLMGILCQESSSGQDTWVLHARTRDDMASDPVIRTSSALNGANEASTTVAEPSATFLRLRRVGDVFTSFYSLTEPASVAAYAAAWTQADERTVAMSTDIRLGLSVGGGTTNELLGASFDFFRFQAGGLPTCDRTPDGIDGCRVHENIHRILAFQGIPRR
jgi:phage-related protein